MVSHGTDSLKKTMHFIIVFCSFFCDCHLRVVLGENPLLRSGHFAFTLSLMPITLHKSMTPYMWCLHVSQRIHQADVLGAGRPFRLMWSFTRMTLGRLQVQQELQHQPLQPCPSKVSILEEFWWTECLHACMWARDLALCAG
jgi:hypothetical protein